MEGKNRHVNQITDIIHIDLIVLIQMINIKVTSSKWKEKNCHVNQISIDSFS